MNLALAVPNNLSPSAAPSQALCSFPGENSCCSKCKMAHLPFPRTIMDTGAHSRMFSDVQESEI